MKTWRCPSTRTTIEIGTPVMARAALVKRSMPSVGRQPASASRPRTAIRRKSWSGPDDGAETMADMGCFT